MLTDCDYVLDKKNRFYIVRGYWNDKDILANLVFIPLIEGDRYNKENGLFYKKVIDENILPIKLNKKDIKKIYKPREKFKYFHKELPEPWKTLAKKLAEIVGIDNVGIFGSYLIGFDTKKDVDFIVYGLDNFAKIKENVLEILKVVNGKTITTKHIKYQMKKHAKYFSNFTNFDKLLRKKWSSIQIAPGILSTIRFAYLENEIPPNPFVTEIAKQIEIKGKVISDLGSNFSPRTFEIESGDKKYTVATYLWIYQSCVRNGDKVSVKGNLHKDEKTITLTEFSHGIRLE